MVRAVVQRVRRASVMVDGLVVGSIERGLLVLVGIRDGDTVGEARRVAAKVSELRIFEDADGKMNYSAGDIQADMLIVSQFTLYADVRRGRRPSFSEAAGPEHGRQLYDVFVSEVRDRGFTVETGQFGARMLVRLENDGPVTLWLDGAEFTR